MSNKNVRSKIWLYAVVLFTSAFIVLLLTAYSQIKLNRNLSELNNQVFTKENEKNKVQLSFANAQELNNKLTEENKLLQEEKDSLSSQLAQLQSYSDNNESLNKSKLDAYLKLCQAQNEYIKGNVVESAEFIKEVDSNLLDSFGNEMYVKLNKEVFIEAGRLLLNEGYELYLDKSYVAAKEKLLKSWSFAPNMEYTDKCLYYLAQSEAKSGNITTGIEQMNILVRQFPSSHYMRSARRFLAKYSDLKP